MVILDMGFSFIGESAGRRFVASGRELVIRALVVIGAQTRFSLCLVIIVGTGDRVESPYLCRSEAFRGCGHAADGRQAVSWRDGDGDTLSTPVSTVGEGLPTTWWAFRTAGSHRIHILSSVHVMKDPHTYPQMWSS